MDSQKWDLRIKEDVDRIYNRIILQTNIPNNSDKVILLVEGYYDREFYKLFVKRKNVLVIYTNGCERMNALAEILRMTDFEYLAIQDSDFAKLGAQNSGMVNMFFTDYHDYEMTCLENRAICSRFNSKLDLLTYGITEGDVFHDIETLSFYRYCSRINDFYNGFKTVGEMVCVTDTLDYQFIHDHVDNSHPRYKEILEGFLKGFVNNNQLVKSDPYNFHNGHDVLNRLVFKINQNNGHPYEGCDEGELQEILVNCTTLKDFRFTSLYKNIKDWEKTHKQVFN